MSRKVAIILRGPPGAGKTAVARELRRRLQVTNSFVILDNFWYPGEQRFEGPARYSDLVDDCDALIVELGYGEPEPENFAGATKNPGEWLHILEAAGREVFLFLLWAPIDESLLRKEGRMNASYTREGHERYDAGNVCSQPVFLPRLPRTISEPLIRTDRQSIEQTIAQILATAGLSEPDCLQY
jgi:hypothetical protein